MIGKLMPWAIVLGGGYMEKDRAEQMLTDCTDIARGAGTSYDMGNIMVLLAANSVEDADPPNPDTFPALVRANLRSPVSSKDVADDYWGVPYRLTIDGDRYTVASAGPDSEFDDEDDIVMEGSLGA